MHITKVQSLIKVEPIFITIKNSHTSHTKRDFWFVKRQRFPVVALEQRLVLKRVHVRRTAFHEQENYALGPGSKMRLPRRQRIIRVQHRSQRHRAKAQCCFLEHVAACHHFR